MLTTTFKLLRKNDACRHRYAVLRKALKGRRDNEPIGIVEVLDHNGLDDALWALRAVPPGQRADRDRLARLFACQCVRQVWNLLDDSSRATVEVAERYAFGEATLDDMAAANAAADANAAYAYADAASAADAYAADDAAARDAQAAKFREMFG